MGGAMTSVFSWRTRWPADVRRVIEAHGATYTERRHLLGDRTFDVTCTDARAAAALRDAIDAAEADIWASEQW
jgi:hypothetical protein